LTIVFLFSPISYVRGPFFSLFHQKNKKHQNTKPPPFFSKRANASHSLSRLLLVYSLYRKKRSVSVKTRSHAKEKLRERREKKNKRLFLSLSRQREFQKKRKNRVLTKSVNREKWCENGAKTNLSLSRTRDERKQKKKRNEKQNHADSEEQSTSSRISSSSIIFKTQSEVGSATHVSTYPFSMAPSSSIPADWSTDPES
jgi:hypothetical protein